MTDEILTGKAAAESDAGYVPMPDETKIEAEEISKEEAAERLASLSSMNNSNVTTHVETNLPENMTMTAEQGAQMLAESREADKAQAELEGAEKERKEIDELRGVKEEPAPARDVEPDIEKTLAHPKVKAALDAHVAEVETQREAHSQGLETAKLHAQALFLETYPEMINVPRDQWVAALGEMQQREPARYAKLEAILLRADRLAQMQQQQQQQRSSREAAEFQTYAKAEDARFDEMFKGDRDMPAIAAQIPQTLKGLGVDPAEFFQAGLKESRFLRSAAAQAVLVKAAKYDMMMANRTKLTPARASIPPVQRPGTTAPRANANSLQELSGKLSRTGNIKDATALLVARRGKR